WTLASRLPGGKIDQQGIVLAAGNGQLSEERRQPPELVLAPGLEGMIVTLGAFQPHPAENAQLLRHDLLRLDEIRNTEDMGGRAAVALGGDAFAGDLIVGFVRGD